MILDTLRPSSGANLRFHSAPKSRLANHYTASIQRGTNVIRRRTGQSEAQAIEKDGGWACGSAAVGTLLRSVDVRNTDGLW
jgi:hypothetical protein